MSILMSICVNLLVLKLRLSLSFCVFLVLVVVTTQGRYQILVLCSRVSSQKVESRAELGSFQVGQDVIIICTKSGKIFCRPLLNDIKLVLICV